MGYRLYINDESDLCCGKLYGYVDGIHLQSLQFLCDIGALDYEISEYVAVYENGDKYNIAKNMFDCNWHIVAPISKENFEIFIWLYFMERHLYFIEKDYSVSEIKKDVESIISKLSDLKLSDFMIIKLHWD